MEPDSWTLVRGARQLLTLHGHTRLSKSTGPRRRHDLSELGIIVDGSVLIHNGIIEAVGPTRRIENMAAARNAEEIDATGRLVMPAFVDAHACLVPVPAYRHGQPAKPIHAMPATRLEAQADELLKLMARHGTGSLGGVSGYACDPAGELKILRAMRSLDAKPLDIASVFFLRTATVNDATYGLLDTVARRKLATIAAVECGEGGVPWPVAEAFLREARSLGLAVRVEVPAERDLRVPDLQIMEGTVALGALSIVVNGRYITPEIEILADSSTVAVLLPLTGSKKGLADNVRQLIDYGALIALGSGLNPQTGGTASMQTVVQFACEVFDLSIEEAISAATLNAAWAVGLGSRTGSLEHRKSGDVLLLNASDYREIPLLAGTNLVHANVKRGVVLFEQAFPAWPRQHVM